MILLEDGLQHAQTGNGSCPGGGPEYVHNHVVRAILNGATGEELNGGNPWNIGETISKPVQYTVPSEIEADSSKLVVLVHKVQGGLSSGEIQQAEEWTLVSPDYVATISSTSEDIIAGNGDIAEFSTVVRSEGLLDDSYYVDITMNAPVGWSGEYETANGIFRRFFLVYFFISTPFYVQTGQTRDSAHLDLFSGRYSDHALLRPEPVQNSRLSSA